ncbi:AAA family ATPase [Streptococcus cristatus]|mgnify:CR=1 FL=1|uniref:AAA family ATPase n=1 Tax=Streptococcus cristatus TaxID=45634 RepID=UPI0039C3DE0B
MKLEELTFGGAPLKIKSSKSEEDSNYYTVLIGENGVGKTKIFEKIISDLDKININDSEIKILGSCEKVIFSTYTLFNRRLPYYYRYGRIYTSNFNSSSIVSEVSQLYFEQLLNVDKNKEKIFNETMNLISKVLSVESSPKIDVSVLSGMKYELLNQKVIKSDIKNINELLYNRLEYIPLNFLENFENKIDRTINNSIDGKSKNFRMLKKYSNRIQTKSTEQSYLLEYCYHSLLSLKLMLMDNRERNQYLATKQNLYSLDTLIEVYKEYFNLTSSAALEVIKNDFKLLDYFGIPFASDLSFNQLGKKVDEGKLITQFSSGEFAFLARLLELAANISRNSLVLIDEPETFLNPKWVFEFVNFLKTVFKNMDCHFIIASQSPFVVGSVKRDDIVKVKKNHSGEIRFEYENNQTLGATFNTILYDVFDLNMDDNLVSENYIKQIKKESKKDILQSIKMLVNLAESEKKMNLMIELSSEENKKQIENKIKDIEEKYFD